MYTSLLEIPFRTAELFPDRISHQYMSKSGVRSLTFAQFARQIRFLTAGFSKYGIKKKDHVGFFMNNRVEWIASDMAMIALGAVSVPRGSDTTPKEVQFIFNHSDSSHLILENLTQLDDLLPVFSDEDWQKCSRIFIADPE